MFTEQELDDLQDALDVMGLALTKHHHTWSFDERKGYDKSTKLIKKAKDVFVVRS
jgi:hypothetical protein